MESYSSSEVRRLQLSLINTFQLVIMRKFHYFCILTVKTACYDNMYGAHTAQS